jgi:hypothetical protein
MALHIKWRRCRLVGRYSLDYGIFLVGFGVLAASVSAGFQQPVTRQICMTVPAGSCWRTLHCTKKPLGCHPLSAGCLKNDGIYVVTQFAKNFTELTYTACHFNNDPNTSCLTQLPIVDCVSFDAYTSSPGVNCGQFQCNSKLTIISCNQSTAVPPYGDPPGTIGGGIEP